VRDVLIWGREETIISVKSFPGEAADILLFELMVNCVILEDHLVAFTADEFNFLGFGVLTAVAVKSVIFLDVLLLD
jgi:hypothetical protein